MTPSSLFRSVGTLLLVTMMALAAKAGVMSEATATQTIKIEIGGLGTADLLFSVVDAATSVSGEGTSATLDVSAGLDSLIGPDVEILDFSGPIDVISELTASADRTSVGTSTADAFVLGFIDIFAVGAIDVSLDVSGDITAIVTGAGPFMSGLAESSTYVDFSIFGGPPTFVVDELVESGGVTAKTFTSQEFDFSLTDSEFATIFFVKSVFAESTVQSNVVPEPASFAVWFGLGLVATGARRRRR